MSTHPFGPALAAGAAGTAVVAALGPLEERLLGRKPVFAPDALVRRLSRRWRHRKLDPKKARVLGIAMRAAYGAAWGMTLAFAPRAVREHPWIAGFTLGVAIASFEELALPASGATPEASRWKPAEHALIVAQTLAFGATATAAFRARAAPEGFLAQWLQR